MVKRNTIKSSENEETLNGIFFFFKYNRVYSSFVNQVVRKIKFHLDLLKRRYSSVKLNIRCIVSCHG